ncbi:MAG TPA: BsuBI/PstI family type II restriction endonuclease [Micromonosporaceae bacterium]|nr:BsuBI/PstI family type II restriction endonuclease [Micromonosporaceae bacterium]
MSSSTASNLPRLLPDRAAYRERLEVILPQRLTGTTDTANPAAAAAAFTCMYVGAIGGLHPIRPSTVLWMSDGAAAHRSDDERLRWYRAALKSRAAVSKLLAAWAEGFEQWYAQDSREPMRDQTFRAWAANGAMLLDQTTTTNASGPRWSLATGFAELLDPDLVGDAFTRRVAKWQEANLSPIARMRRERDLARARDEAGVTVQLPGGNTRVLHTGTSSEILRGVIEDFCRVLSDPAVVFISQPREPIRVEDRRILQQLGMSLDHRRLLPDCLVADLDPSRDEFWLIEVAATDGPVTEERKARLTDWATGNGLRENQLRFLSAFESRTSAPAKKHLPNLARGSHAWFLDEPDGILSWIDLAVADG